MQALSVKFDWVTEWAKCSVEKMFSVLESEVKSDVEVRNKLSKETLDGRSFSFSEAARGFLVMRSIAHTPVAAKVDFLLKDDCIEISGFGHSSDLRVGMALTSNGSCKYNVSGQEMESWQVRRMALEKLFFGD